jgi:signal transduction histidine kinase
VREFQGLQLKGESKPMLQAIIDKRKPLLVSSRPGQSTAVSVPEYDFMHVKKVAQRKRLLKQNTDQWFEMPLLLQKRVVAKAVVDHKGQKDTGFTLSELRLLSTLGQFLCIAADKLAYLGLKSSLFREGSQASLVRHRMSNSLTQLLNESQPRLFRERVNGALKSLKSLEAFCRGAEKRSQSGTNLRREVLKARELITNLGLITLQIPTNFPRIGLKVPTGSLSLMILVLLENAINAINKAAKMKCLFGNGLITIEAQRLPGGTNTCEISVSDNGVGVSPLLAKRLSESATPFLRRKDGHGRGLAYAKAFAREMGWKLSLSETRNPTVFRLRIPFGK